MGRHQRDVIYRLEKKPELVSGFTCHVSMLFVMKQFRRTLFNREADDARDKFNTIYKPPW